MNIDLYRQFLVELTINVKKRVTTTNGTTITLSPKFEQKFERAQPAYLSIYLSIVCMCVGVIHSAYTSMLVPQLRCTYWDLQLLTKYDDIEIFGQISASSLTAKTNERQGGNYFSYDYFVYTTNTSTHKHIQIYIYVYVQPKLYRLLNNQIVYAKIFIYFLYERDYNFRASSVIFRHIKSYNRYIDRDREIEIEIKRSINNLFRTEI